MKSIIYGLFSVIVLLGCRKPVPETSQTETQAKEIAPPGSGEIQLVRDLMVKQEFMPSAEQIKSQKLTKECLDVKTSEIKILNVMGRYAVLESRQVNKSVFCEVSNTVLENSQGKWSIKDLGDRDAVSRLVDVDNDGHVDLIRFRGQAGGDGPTPIVDAVYMGGIDGRLTKISDPVLDQCVYGGSVQSDEYLDLRPCKVIINCLNSEKQTIQYDCALKKFVAR